MFSAPALRRARSTSLPARLAIVGLLSAAVLTLLSACTGTSGGTLRVLAGEATVNGTAVDGDRGVASGAIVEVSGSDALVEIQWPDGSFTRLAADTTFTVGGDGVRGTLDAGSAWSAVGANAGSYAVGTSDGTVTASAGTTFGLRCASSCEGVAASGVVTLVDQELDVEAPASFTLSSAAVDAAPWDAVYADGWAIANSERDEEAGFTPAADVWKDRDPALASLSGVFSGPSTPSIRECNGWPAQCERVQTNLFDKDDGVADQTFSTDCGDTLPCTNTIEFTTDNTDGSSREVTQQLTFDGSTYSYDWVPNTGVYCVFPDGREEGAWSNNVHGEFTPTKAEVRDGVFVVTELSNYGHADVRTDAPTSDPSCSKFEFDWVSEGTSVTSLVESAAVPEPIKLASGATPLRPQSGAARPTVVSNLHTPAAAIPNLFQLGVIIGGVIILVVLVAYPGFLLSRVVSDRYDSIAGERVASLRQRVESRPIGRWLVIGVGFVVAAIITAALDPVFGTDVSSWRLMLTALIAFVIFIGVGAVVVQLAARRLAPEAKPVLQFRWGSLLILVAGVVLSRIFSFSPGVIFGMVAGLAFAASLPVAKRAILTLIGAGYAAVIGLTAWVAFGALAPLAEADPTNAGLVFGTELFSVLTIEAISTLPLVLLPFAGMDGAAIRSWKLWAWLVSYAVALALFFFVVIAVPDSWAAIQGDAIRWIVIFVVFTVVAVGIYLLNERTKKKPAVAEAVAAPVETPPATKKPSTPKSKVPPKPKPKPKPENK